jgi:hypothetical protein
MAVAKRQALQTVRDNSNLKIGEKQFDEQVDLARHQIELVRADGDKVDLEAYVDNAEENLEPALERFADAEEELADRFKQIFLPPYDSSSNERWVEFAAWEDWADDVQGCALRGSPRQSRDLRGRPVGCAAGHRQGPGCPRPR